MEYMIGGDFLGLLLRFDVLEESTAKWYVAQMILCIEEAHKMKWIHRDIKPDNFLISASGHLKISDFGLAFDGHWSHSQMYYTNQRENLLERVGIEVAGDELDVAQDVACGEMEHEWKPRRRDVPSKSAAEEHAHREGLLDWRNRNDRKKMARSIVGTSQYMAPEVIQGYHYDGRCDWWSIGIILYECLYGRTPFYRDNRNRTKECIVNHRRTLHFPSGARHGKNHDSPYPEPSPVAVDLLKAILCEKERRLSSRQYRHSDPRMPARRLQAASLHNSLVRHVFANDAEEIKHHPFFIGIPWERLHTSEPPFVPRVRANQSITKYFEDEKDIMSEETSSYASMKKHIPDDAAEEDVAVALGHHFQRWKAERMQREKRELGMDMCRDSSLTRIREHLGAEYEQWKAQRMVEVAEVRAEMGIEVAPQEARREKRRPRDKVLRDPMLNKQALEVRKKKAFFGYTYRRPKPMWSHEGPIRYRRARIARPTILPVYQARSSEEEGYRSL
ncbi:Putative protein kinase [Septoria linicola]|uniref:non-specific serine/threonine protein kinase n=1 Tax=Septoria linicola TaxID=215465 RepID=A0A9Q9B3B8_9PEZI|nr:putative protein kinase [Septoria linicola]USW56652.1 Putative protein kinase [Septoria linicola]